MKVSILNVAGKEIGTREVLAGWETRRIVPALLHQAVVTARANLRRPWAHTKGRGEVRGGGRKPWRQKGTGRARHGSIRSPIWKGGGVTFGPRAERTYAKRFSSSMRRTALAMAVLAKARDAEVHLVERFPETAKTRDFVSFLERIGMHGSVIVLFPSDQRSTLTRAGRNVLSTRVADPATVTAADVLQATHIIATPESWAVVERRLEANAPRASASSAVPETHV